MNTEQLKIDKPAIEILREEYKSNVTSKDIDSLHDEIDQFCDDEELETRNAILSAMQIFASQESKRAMYEFKEKLENELLNARLWVDAEVNKSYIEHVLRFIKKL